MKKAIDRAKLENVEWFSRFTVLERIRIARKNLLRTRKLKGLALKRTAKGV
ncbi:MAG TPA: hypothetical protein VJL62_01410 [Thermodesulfobacteriota bacterium]|nr:hypothetical protein [Thermodesulfobacteriota bacterium]